MVSLCFRSLANYINGNDLEGLQSFLESKQVQIDDRDEVRFLCTLKKQSDLLPLYSTMAFIFALYFVSNYCKPINTYQYNFFAIKVH